MGRRLARFAARAAILAAFWWLPWSLAFAREAVVFDALTFLSFVPAAMALAQGVLASLVLAWIEKRTRRELDILWFVRAKHHVDAAGVAESRVDPRIACPWCGGAALTRRAKATMGPAVRAPCASCGAPVSVSAKPMLAIVLGNVAALAFWWPEPRAYRIWLAWVGIVPIVAGVFVAFVANDRKRLVKR